MEPISRLVSNGPVESDEIYFISNRADNVKVRDRLMDVKVLRAVNSAGLERWEPVMKSGFPLSSADVAQVLSALRIPPRFDLPETASLTSLMDAFSQADSGVQVVNVHKSRRRFTVEGCMAELSDIIANGLSIRTIAVESENPEAVLRGVESLGLGGYSNTNYRRALADLIAGVPERFAVIDVGTNSVKFHIGARNRDGSWSTIVDRADVTRLGERLTETGRIGDAAQDRTADAIAHMVVEAKRCGVRATAAVGTAALRIAANAAEVIASIRRRSGMRVEVISGDEETRLAYVATTAALVPVAGTTAVFDTGGGSSQFTFGRSGRIEERFSIDVGAARYADRFGLDHAVSEHVVREAIAAISTDLSKLDGRTEPDALVGMGGAVTNITAVSLGLSKYDPDRVHGATITKEEVERQIELFRSKDAKARCAIVGLQPARAEVILAGVCIVRTILEKLGKSSLTVSDRGLRYGILAERFGD